MPTSCFSLRTYVNRLLLALCVTLQGQIALAQASKPVRIAPEEFFALLANQPDAAADILATLDFPQLGGTYVTRIRVVRKNGRLRREIFPLENETNLRAAKDKDYKLVLLSSAGQSLLLDPQTKAYAESPAEFEAAAFDIEKMARNKAKDLSRVRLENFGPSSSRVAGQQSSE